MRKALVLLTSVALLAPAATVATPSEAVTTLANSDEIKQCSKRQFGTTMRIKMRDRGGHVMVRISHPRASGNFRNPEIVKARGHGIWENREGRLRFGKTRRLPPTFRMPTARNLTMSVNFYLKNGKFSNVYCTFIQPCPPPKCQVGDAVARDKKRAQDGHNDPDLEVGVADRPDQGQGSVA